MSSADAQYLWWLSRSQPVAWQLWCVWRKGSLSARLRMLLYSSSHNSNVWRDFKDSPLKLEQRCLLPPQAFLSAFSFPWQLWPVPHIWNSKSNFVLLAVKPWTGSAHVLHHRFLSYHCWPLFSIPKSACGCSWFLLTRCYPPHIASSFPPQINTAGKKSHQLFWARFNFWFSELSI